MKNYYKILNIPVTASEADVKEAYDLKSVQYYRDRDIVTEDFFDIKEAYYTLSSRYKRASYDKDFLIYFPDYTESVQKEISDVSLVEELPEAETEPETDVSTAENEDRAIESVKDIEIVKVKRIDGIKPDYTLPHGFPKKDHWGRNLARNVDFFKLPVNIGEIISAYSTLTRDKQPPDRDKTTQICILWAFMGLGVAGFLYLFLSSYEEFMSMLWIILPAFGCVAGYIISRFRHTVTYVGRDGFAKFKCRDSRDNITEAFELHFSQVTELIQVKEIVTGSGKNSNTYEKTNFIFAWLDKESIQKEVKGSHRSQSDNPSKNKTDYWLHHFAAACWTNRVLKQLEKKIEGNEEIEFTLYREEDYIYKKRGSLKLGADYITIVLPDREKTCRFEEARRIYAKDDFLYIEYMNYKKKIFFADEGNRDKISLNYLGNREVFYEVLEKRLGIE